MTGPTGSEGPASGVAMSQVLLGAGDVGRDLAAVEWASTPLGEPEQWPQSLKTMVGSVLASRFSMWLAWGRELTFFCNDAYRRDTLATKYPWALGRPAAEVWAEIWPEIGPRIEHVLLTGEATWDEGLLLFLERSGYVEETYHTFSYSPLRGDDGVVAGMLCVVSEVTDRVIGERRLATLRSLGSDPTSLRTESDVYAFTGRQLDRDRRTFPYTAGYVFEDDDGARLAWTSGIEPGHAGAPWKLDMSGDVSAVARGESVVLQLDPALELPTGEWADPPTCALAVPLPSQVGGRPYGFLVAALNRYRPLDDGYRGFVDLVAAQVAAQISSARAYEAERRRAEQLAELDATKTAFFTSVSHEFRTPLTLLLGPTEDALADVVDPLSERQRARTEMVARNAKRLLHLVNTVLDFSRLESGEVDAHFEPTDLARDTRDLALMFESAVRRAGLTLTVDAPPLREPVVVDREMWAKIVLNLLSNALKFTLTGGISVTLSTEGGEVVLAVSDTGVGIDPAERPRLFERFHRAPRTRARSHEGSGIGLALVAELVAVHHGSVDVSSTPDEGSTFVVRVPLGTRHLPPEQVVAPGRRSAADVSSDIQARRLVADALRWLDDTAATGGELLVDESLAAPSAPQVLVVDDNPDMRQYVARLLGGTYRVRTAMDGREGLAAALDEVPDLVLTDVMMPNLDGFGLLAALRADARTSEVPVVMLSARAGEEGTVEGLEAGADDYLTKPFSARELLARVRANLELDRSRRARQQLQLSRELLDQAQRLAGVGSWELDLRDGRVRASGELLRQLQVSAEELEALGLKGILDRFVHPDDRLAVDAALDEARRGVSLDLEIRLRLPDGQVRRFRTIGEVDHGDDGTPLRLRGSNQDVTEQREAAAAVVTAAALREAAARELFIADELQRSLLPTGTFDPRHLHVATYYRAGVDGTQVGGDWYDVIELGAGRTALVLGDVMGRGVRAAAVMGQLRSAIRAYARLDLPPADVLEFLDGVVRDLREDQIVTCVYAVYDPADRTIAYANAGQLPPLLVVPGEPARRLTSAGPPLGTGPVTLDEEHLVLPEGALLALYTDGLVERRDRDIDAGIEVLAAHLPSVDGELERGPDVLVAALLQQEPEDDVALLLARVPDGTPAPEAAVLTIPSERSAVASARDFTAATVARWKLSARLAEDVVLTVSELVTNAVLYGRPPVRLRLRRSDDELVVEVYDHATFLPRRLRPTPHDEHGRGLELVSMLASRWGTRPTQDGKCVWCLYSLRHDVTAAHAR